MLEKKHFKLGCCLEQFITENGIIYIAVPMVCFCNIPFSKLHKHMDAYGDYGIGLSKDWARSKRLNPVMYMDSKSRPTQSLATAILKQLENDAEGSSNDLRAQKVYDLLRYTKPYEGDHPKKKGFNYVFSDEREWRYVPDWDADLDPFTPIEDPSDWESKKKNIREKYISENLAFEYSDIEYITVKNDNEIESIWNTIKSLVQNDSEMRLLLSRIVTRRFLNEDL